MDVQIKFLGGAGSVTGSKYLLKVDQKRYLIDCGLFQGLKELRERNWNDLPEHARDIDAVFITHAHLDHTGYLPRLFRQGYEGPVICTHATAELMEILLRDSAKLQEEEAIFAKKKGYSKHEEPEPLYDLKDAEKVFPNIRSYPLGTCIEFNEQINLCFYKAGHILGAAIVEVELKGDHQHKKIIFSGDIGRYNDPILPPPTPVEHADILLIESTYGDRNCSVDNPREALGDAINEGLKRGGVIMIPAFAVGRSQALLYHINRLMTDGCIPEVPIYMDSPMAITTTQLYLKYDDFHKLKKEEFLHDESFAMLRKHLKIIQKHSDSVALNDIQSNAIIISASGMMTGGRILHHLHHRLKHSNDTLLIAGYQADGTRGRRIVSGEETIRIFGDDVPVNCHIKMLEGLSAHAYQNELIQWMSGISNKPKAVYIVHGEEHQSGALKREIEQTFGWNAIVPDYLETFKLFEGI